MLSRRTLLAALATPAIPSAKTPVKLGLITTLDGPAADGAGPGSLLAARLAMEDRPGTPATLIAADIGARPETGAAIARQWLDEAHLHAILDVPNSATALAVATLVRDRNAIALFSGPGATALIRNEAWGCNPNHLQYTYNTSALAAGLARAILDQGGRTWFFITADYVFGHDLQNDIAATLATSGGTVLGSTAFPGETSDFSAPLLQAQSSGADIVCLAAAGAPFETLVKQAAEFGIARKQRLAAPLCLTTNTHAIGLENAQGLLLASTFYQGLTPATQAFAARFAPRNRGIPPTMVHAGVYAATTRLLDAVAAGADPADGAATIAAMARLPGTDPLFGTSAIRPDGSVAHDVHLFQVKTPAESTAPWDAWRPLQTIPASTAYPANSRCK